ncbi:CGNR zinc finger domain-containing protein [Brachybacterium squillarum]|uniref:CGNR zinc finger domain-containing protein n=1 Tax=Brachybacterium squillarum TaxID=661979 RepID=UPI0002629FCF|nr:CGNR zinc finger domain-containing protein [Brachybacterium squillarum]
MHLNPYGEYAVRLAQSLSDDWPANRSGIVDRTREHGMSMPFPAQPGDHARCRDIIDQWLLIVNAPSAEARAALLNEQMAVVTAYPRLTDHDGEGWHLHYRDIDDDLPVVLRSVIAVGTAIHLTTRGITRLGRCGSTPCRRVIVDTSRNGTQRCCSPRGASRDAVRRHRARSRRD